MFLPTYEGDRKMQTRTLMTIFTGVFIGLAGCGELIVIDSTTDDEPAVFGAPELLFGKSDQSSNTQLGAALERGSAASGETVGFTALPVQLERGEVLTVQGWTSRASVLMVYGPRFGAEWNLEQVRAATRDAEPGVHTESLQFEAPESGDYLVVVGADDGITARWIVARGAP